MNIMQSFTPIKNFANLEEHNYLMYMFRSSYVKGRKFIHYNTLL